MKVKWLNVPSLFMVSNITSEMSTRSLEFSAVTKKLEKMAQGGF